MGVDVELIAALEGGGLNTLGGLNGEVDVVDGAEDFIYLADRGLVLQVHDGVELRDLDIDALADHLAFARVDEFADRGDLRWWAEIALLETSTACRSKMLVKE